MERQMTEIERAAQAVDLDNHSAVVDAVKRIMEQEYLKNQSMHWKCNVAAEVMRRSSGWIRRYIRFADAHPAILALLQMHRILADEVEVLSRLTPEQQHVAACTLEQLTLRSEVKDYMREHVYPLLPAPGTKGARAPRAKPTYKSSTRANADSVGPEVKQNCIRALGTALEVLEPLFDQPLRLIVEAFRGTPRSRAEFLEGAEASQQMLSVITAALKKEYGNG